MSELNSLSPFTTQLLARLNHSKAWLITAESCTGGLLAHAITDVPGSSACYWGGITCYANSAKSELLKVPPSLLEQFGAVSEEVARTLSERALDLLAKHASTGTIYSIATTGIAGPSGGTPTKPVGLCWISISSQSPSSPITTVSFSVQNPSPHDRHENKVFFARSALERLIEVL